MCIKKFLVVIVIFFFPSICVFASSELDKLLDEARKLKEKGEKDDAVDAYSEILKKYDLILLGKPTLLEIWRELAYYYFSKENYSEAQKFFNLILSHRLVNGDELQDVIYKFCSSIYFLMPCRAGVDLEKCYELRNAVKTYSRYVKNRKILKHMNEMCEEALSLFDERKCLNVEYYFKKGHYGSALFLCDKYLTSIHDKACCKRLLVLKLKSLAALRDFRNFVFFFKFFEKVKSQYRDIYLANKTEFDKLYSAFCEFWKREKEVVKNKKKNELNKK